MAKRARNTGRYSPPARPPQHQATGLDPRVKLGAIAAAVIVVVAGLLIAAIAFAAAFSTGASSSLPPGTQTFTENDHAHVAGPVTYDRVPPVGGAHNPVQLNCGVYSEVVPNENAVHSLEHGAVWITYQPTLPPDQLALLQQFVTSHYVGTERYLILSPYAGIPSPIVASAWGAQLGVGVATDPRLAEFVAQFAGGGQGGEKGGPCTGGVGSPAE